MTTTLFDHINELARNTAWAHGLVLGYATYGLGLFALLLAAGWWMARSRGPRLTAAALWAGAATLLAVAVNQPIVAAVGEARPYASRTDILVLAHRSADPSFPSDHAVMAGAVAAGLLLVSRRLAAVAAVAAVLMAFSRVYIAAHYPQDVLAGLALGAGVAWGGWLVVRVPLTWLVQRLSHSPIRPLLVAGLA